MLRLSLIACFATTAVLFAAMAAGDEVLHRYETNVVPYDASAGRTGGGCQPPCHETIEDGHLVLRWDDGADTAAYSRWIARPPEPSPPSLWVEWRFRSNHPIPPTSPGCDGWMSVYYDSTSEIVFLYGDAALSNEGSDYVLGLDMSEFHTYRFESDDGIHHRVSVDGRTFILSQNITSIGTYLRFGGQGGCSLDMIPDNVNEWDFVRYGTLSYGEQIVSTEPPGLETGNWKLETRTTGSAGASPSPLIGGFVDARRWPALDRFTVTYDAANYVYIDEITVQSEPWARAHGPNGGSERVTGLALGALIAPTVVATRRLDNGPPETVEIVLDEPIPFNATTRFTFNDGTIEQTVEFTYAPGDTDGDGDADLADFAGFQTCFGPTPEGPVCPLFDFNADGVVDLLDFAAFQVLGSW